MTKLLLSFTALSLGAAAACAEVKMPAVFGDHMVLQQDIKLPVFGTADPGEKITVSIGGRTAETVAGPDGKWIVRLDPLPVTRVGITLIVAGANRLEFNDVLVGDVWICSGQSNMEFGVGAAYNAPAALAAADQPQIRLLLLPHRLALDPASDVDAKWVVCTKASLGKGGWDGFSAVGYYFGKEIQETRKIPVGLIGMYWGGTPAQAWTSIEALRAEPTLQRHVDRFEQAKGQGGERRERYEKEILPKWQLAHDAWEAQQAAADPAQPAGREPRRPAFEVADTQVPSVLFNGMIAPLIPYGIKGVVWYQGETNGDREADAREYHTVFSTMIGDWRQRWGVGEFPFLFVQLAGYGPKPVWPIVREGQRQTLSLPNTGMAVALDVGEETDVHPKNKSTVGHRLALAARRVAYGEDIVAAGPMFARMEKEGARIRVAYTSTGGGLVIGSAPTGRPEVPPAAPLDHLEGFEIAGADGNFVPARALIDGASVIVWAADVPEPDNVRYGWQAFPTVNLYNKEGLPAVPFMGR